MEKATISANTAPSDTDGFEHELRIIERKLGPLDTSVRRHLRLVEVSYFSFTDSTCRHIDPQHQRTGHLLVHERVADEVQRIFTGLLRDTFPIAKVVPIMCYGLNADSTGWNDEASMKDNNTSAFNYRGRSKAPGLSTHALGTAIDINPKLNPLVRETGQGAVFEPPNGRYEPERPGTLTRAIVKRCIWPHGWSWGGLWHRPQDHQHIEKKIHPTPTVQ